MARSSAPVLACPVCTSPLVEIRLGASLAMRSCSTCDGRWWQQGDDPAELGDVLAVVGSNDRSRRAAAEAR